MRYLKYLFLADVGICLIVLALANRGTVTLKLFPDEFVEYFGQYSFELPLYVVIFAAIFLGLCIGFVWEWFREHKLRVDGRLQKREKNRLEREVKGLKREKHQGKDDVLALLDDASTAR